MRRLHLALVLICSALSADEMATLTVQSHLGAGFFAELGKVVDSLLHFERYSLGYVYVDWSQEFFPYKDGIDDNGWDLYFEPIGDSLVTSKPEYTFFSSTHHHELHDQRCIDHWIHYDEALPYRLNANRIINTYIRLKPALQEEWSSLFKAMMEGFYCIGVHVRFAEAHRVEAPAGTPSLQMYIEEVQRLLKGKDLSRVRIYLATDSHYVVNRFKEEFSDSLLTLEAFRAPYQEDPHLIFTHAEYWKSHKEEWHQRKPGYYGGKTVLLDCLLLSKCDIFVHSSSNVSEFVSYFNPHIKSVYLPKNAFSQPCRYQVGRRNF